MSLATVTIHDAIVNNRFFRVLFVFVSFNTIVYVSLAVTKLLPRRRR
jgi:hypothetical protein